MLVRLGARALLGACFAGQATIVQISRDREQPDRTIVNGGIAVMNTGIAEQVT